MLNTVLTVRAGQANSHKGMGWETFTDTVIQKLSEREKPVIFVLWGKPAQTKKALIDDRKTCNYTSTTSKSIKCTSRIFRKQTLFENQCEITERGETANRFLPIIMLRY